MVDVSELPVIGKVVTAGAVVGDLFLHSGEFVLALLGGILEVVVGSPELALPVISSARRLGLFGELLPPGILDTLLGVAAVALFVKYAGEFILASLEKA